MIFVSKSGNLRFWKNNLCLIFFSVISMFQIQCIGWLYLTCTILSFFIAGNKKIGGILQCSLHWIYSIWLLAFLHNKAFLWQPIPSFLQCQFWNIGVSVVFRDHNFEVFSSLDYNIVAETLPVLWYEDLTPYQCYVSLHLGR